MYFEKGRLQLLSMAALVFWLHAAFQRVAYSGKKYSIVDSHLSVLSHSRPEHGVMGSLFAFYDTKVRGMDMIEYLRPHTERYHNSQPLYIMPWHTDNSTRTVQYSRIQCGVSSLVSGHPFRIIECSSFSSLAVHN